MDRETHFNEAVARCREKQEQFRTLEFRTLLFLYGMLGDAHALAVEMQTDAALRATFYRALALEKMRKGNDEVLLLVEYLFCPHVLLGPGPDNKTDITKVSPYAQLLRKAISANIHPADFVRFARKHKIQGTGRASSKGNVTPPNTPAADGSEPPTTSAVATNPATPVIDVPEPPDETFIGEVWFNNAKLSRQAAEACRAAKTVPLQMKVTYITHPIKQERVVTAMAVTPLRRRPIPFAKVAPVEATAIKVGLGPKKQISATLPTRARSEKTATRGQVSTQVPTTHSKPGPQRRIGPGWPPPWPRRR